MDWCFKQEVVSTIPTRPTTIDPPTLLPSLPPFLAPSLPSYLRLQGGRNGEAARECAEVGGEERGARVGGVLCGDGLGFRGLRGGREGGRERERGLGIGRMRGASMHVPRGVKKKRRKEGGREGGREGGEAYVPYQEARSCPS